MALRTQVLRAIDAVVGGQVTLLEGSTFAVSDRDGDMAGHRPHGLFFRDTRIVSTWRLTVDDQPLDALAAVPEGAYAATFLARMPPREGLADPSVLVHRRRLVGDGLREDVSVVNHGLEPVSLRLHLDVDADFADLFDVKDGRPAPPFHIDRQVLENEIAISIGSGARARGVRVHAAEGVAQQTGFAFAIVVPAHHTWRTTVEVLPSLEGREVSALFPVGVPVHESAPARRVATLQTTTPLVRTGSQALNLALARSTEDLSALQITDPLGGAHVVLAAGAPWFMTLFGRDCLLSSWMAIPFDPVLALGALEALAVGQGRRVDPSSEEEPGRILHEVRRGVEESRGVGGAAIYYGTADATPLFVMLLDEAARWGADPDQVRALLPAADAALDWIRHYGDVDGDGFVEYRRKTHRGLINQGWKDSHDGISSADGRLAVPPVALVEVQAYVYGAYRARAHLAELSGDPAGVARWNGLAEDLRQRFDAAFWLPDRGHYAVALGGDKEPLDSLTSNIGHALWTGIALDSRIDDVAGHLVSPDLFSGWGVRTLATSMSRYNPVSYHNGSVWPHDNAIIVAGLIRCGRVEAAHRVATGLLDAADAFDGRLPEVFCGFDRRDLALPVPYPSANAPQAWASATPMSLIRSVLRLEPCVPHGRVAIAPAVPESWGRVQVYDLPLGSTVVDIDSSDPEPLSCPDGAGLRVVTAPDHTPPSR
jgi:glycogen debranching enzyme